MRGAPRSHPTHCARMHTRLQALAGCKRRAAPAAAPCHRGPPTASQPLRASVRSAAIDASWRRGSTSPSTRSSVRPCRAVSAAGRAAPEGCATSVGCGAPRPRPCMEGASSRVGARGHAWLPGGARGEGQGARLGRVTRLAVGGPRAGAARGAGAGWRGPGTRDDAQLGVGAGAARIRGRGPRWRATAALPAGRLRPASRGGGCMSKTATAGAEACRRHHGAGLRACG